MPSSAEFNTILNRLGPHLALTSDIGGELVTNTKDITKKSAQGFDEALNFLRTIMGGDRNAILSLLNSSDISKGLDEQIKQNYELAPRGGRRAATAANLGFEKFANLNSLLQQLKGQAPDKIANIAATLAGVAQGNLGLALNSQAAVINASMGHAVNAENFAQQAADRRNALLGSIIGTGASIAGILACNTLDTWIMIPGGHKTLKEINVGDIVCSPTDLNANFEELKVIRKEIIDNQDIYSVTINGSHLKGTLSHVIVANNGDEVSFDELYKLQEDSTKPNIPIIIDDDTIRFKSFKKVQNLKYSTKVAILKLKDEKANYRYVTNGIISIDADCI